VLPALEDGNNLVHYFVSARTYRPRSGVTLINPDEVAERNKRALKVLLDWGFDINQRNQNGETPLNLDIASSDRYMVDVLLQNGADPNIGNNDGVVPLHKACMFNNFHSVLLLIDGGSKLTTNRTFSKTPSQCTSSWKIKLYLLFRKILNQ
jgi:ankyrin repeat protein